MGSVKSQIHVGFDMNADSTTHYVYVKIPVYSSGGFKRAISEISDGLNFKKGSRDGLNFWAYVRYYYHNPLANGDYNDGLAAFVDSINAWLIENEY